MGCKNNYITRGNGCGQWEVWIVRGVQKRGKRLQVRKKDATRATLLEQQLEGLLGMSGRHLGKNKFAKKSGRKAAQGKNSLSYRVHRVLGRDLLGLRRPSRGEQAVMLSRQHSRTNFSLLEDHLEGFSQPKHPPHSYWFSWSRVGLRIYIFDKFPSDAGIWEPLMES